MSDFTRYRMKYVVLKTHEMGEVEFDAYDDDDAWRQADYANTPEGASCYQLVEASDPERNVPVPMSAIASVVEGILSRPKDG